MQRGDRGQNEDSTRLEVDSHPYGLKLADGLINVYIHTNLMTACTL